MQCRNLYKNKCVGSVILIPLPTLGSVTLRINRQKIQLPIMVASAPMIEQFQTDKNAPTATSKIANDLGDVESLEIALMLCTVRCNEDNTSNRSSRTISGEQNYRPLPVNTADPFENITDGDTFEDREKKVNRLIMSINF